MKRYWKLLVLIPLILISIGVYYVDASARKPTYYLMTQSGDPKEASQIELQARDSVDSVSIDLNGSTYKSQQSFWQSLDSGYYYTNDLKRLADEYPSFMRGKQNPQGFYVDNHVIGYATVLDPGFKKKENYQIQVAVLNRDTKSSSSFTFSLPKKSIYTYVSFSKEVVIGNTMKIFTINYTSGASEAHVYTIDLQKKTVVSDEPILSYPNTAGDNQVALSVANQMDSLQQKSDYVLYQVTSSSQTQSNEQPKENTDVFVYDFQNDRITKLEDATVNAFFKPMRNVQQSQQVGNDLVLLVQDGNQGTQVIRYSIDQHKVTSQYKLAAAVFQGANKAIDVVEIRNNRMYTLVSSQPNGAGFPAVIVSKLDDGSVVYKGVVATKAAEDAGTLSNYTLSMK